MPNRRERRNRIRRLIAAQDGKCAYCTRPFKTFGFLRPTVDHVVPKSAGGTFGEGNAVAACYGCNQAKGTMTPDEYRARLAGGFLPIDKYEWRAVEAIGREQAMQEMVEISERYGLYDSGRRTS